MKCYRPLILKTPSRKRGFTLIELMVVITIIIVLVGIVLAVGTVLGASAASTQTKNTIQILDTALTEWEAQSNRQLTWGTDGNPFAGSYYDMQIDTSHIFLVSEMLATVGRLTQDGNGNTVSPNSQIGSLLAQIDPKKMHIYRYSGFSSPAPPWLRESELPTFRNTEPDPNVANWVSQYQSRDWNGRAAVLDAWDRPIRFIHAGRLWVDGDPFPDAENIPDTDGTIKTINYEKLYGYCVNRRPYFVSAGPDGKFGDVSANPQNEAAMYKATLDNIYSYEVIKP